MNWRSRAGFSDPSPMKDYPKAMRMTQDPSVNPLQPSYRVLIVEDDTLVGMGLLSQLQKLGHVVVGQASTAAQALQLFRETRPDVVLMDIRLDGADGIELATLLLKERRC